MNEESSSESVPRVILMTALELKLSRVQLGLTQWSLALQLGLHPARLSEMETGKRSVPEDVDIGIRAALAALTATPTGVDG